MCFSATASFVSAGVLGVVGGLCLIRTTEPRQLGLAAMPLIFALQQASEGLLWRSLAEAPAAAASEGLVLCFLFIAQVVWPVYAPAAVCLAEPRHERQRLMLAPIAVGAGLSAWLLWLLMTHPFSASIEGGSICYATSVPSPYLPGLAYLAAVCLPFLMSSHRAVAAFGVIILVGFGVSYLAYRTAFLSVWCFFAAIGSATLLFHFERARRRHLTPAVALSIGG